MAGRRPGKSRILSIYQICRQVQQISQKRGINPVDFADSFEVFVNGYSKILELQGRKRLKLGRTKEYTLKNTCKYVWNYLSRHKVDQADFALIFKSYCEIKTGFVAYKKALNDFRSAYNSPREYLAQPSPNPEHLSQMPT